MLMSRNYIEIDSIINRTSQETKLFTSLQLEFMRNITSFTSSHDLQRLNEYVNGSKSLYYLIHDFRHILNDHIEFLKLDNESRDEFIIDQCSIEEKR